MSYRVCIPTAGTGSRLGSLTKHLNKSLVSVEFRPVLSHIIEKFPRDAHFVVALGYQGPLVRDFLTLAYPDRAFTFVNVSPYEGPGSGLGLTLLACAEHLQQPFVFTSCDTLVREESIPPPTENWVGYCEETRELDSFRTVEVCGSDAVCFHDKREATASSRAYIGLAGVTDAALFWQVMRDGVRQGSIEMGEVFALKALLKKGVRAVPFGWLDTGTPENLAKTRAALERPGVRPNVLDKEGESIWLLDERVIKYSHDADFIRNRVARVAQMRDFVPRLIDHRPNLYAYSRAQGDVLSHTVDTELFRKLWQRLREFWEPRQLAPAEREAFERGCLAFYREKTISRVHQFQRQENLADGTDTINGVAVPSLEELLARVPWASLQQGSPTRFHGDLHFENILHDPKSGAFTFLDWRQDFNGDLAVGDTYYDLAKLLHGMIVSHEMVTHDRYSVERAADGGMRIAIDKRPGFDAIEEEFARLAVEAGFDFRKVEILTALIFLNIAPLHHRPYHRFLYLLGKSYLHKILTGEKDA